MHCVQAMRPKTAVGERASEADAIFLRQLTLSFWFQFRAHYGKLYFTAKW